MAASNATADTPGSLKLLAWMRSMHHFLLAYPVKEESHPITYMAKTYGPIILKTGMSKNKPQDDEREYLLGQIR